MELRLNFSTDKLAGSKAPLSPLSRNQRTVLGAVGGAESGITAADIMGLSIGVDGRRMDGKLDG